MSENISNKIKVKCDWGGSQGAYISCMRHTQLFKCYSESCQLHYGDLT